MTTAVAQMWRRVPNLYAGIRTVSTASNENLVVPNIISRYNELAKQGVLRPDPSQLACLERLQQLLGELKFYGISLVNYESSSIEYTAQWNQNLPSVKQHVESAIQQDASGSPPRWWTAALAQFGGKPNQPKPNLDALIKQKMIERIGPPPEAPSPPIGVYLHGDVGSGKTMIADMLYSAAAEAQVLPLQRRLHSNSALLELHSRMHTIEKAEKLSMQRLSGDASAAAQLAKGARRARIVMRRLAREKAESSMDEFSRALGASNSTIMLRAAKALLRGDTPQAGQNTMNRVPQRQGSTALLCLDEMQTNDPFNVAALKALTEATLADGGVIVTTSNRSPKLLTRHGLHEEMFWHFVETLEGGCDVLELGSGIDYRRTTVQQRALKKEGKESISTTKRFFHPLNSTSEAELEAAWKEICSHEEERYASSKSKSIPEQRQADANAALHVPVMFGRTLQVTRHCHGAAFFTFEELCARPLGPADYLAVASTFHTVFISDIPAMSMRVRDKARRFITLIDELYNAGSRLVCSASVDIDDLFVAAGEEGNEEPLVDLEGLQFEGAVEGASLRRDVRASGGVAPVEATVGRVGSLGGAEEAFAFARAVSRLHEMQRLSYGRACGIVGIA